MNTTNTYEKVLEYTNRGFVIIPANHKQKNPSLHEWKKYQTTKPTEEELKKWFEGQERNILIVCGKISKNLVVIDFDTPDGFEKILGTEYLDKTLVVKTKKGHHVYFKTKTIVNSFNFDGGEVQSEGKLVIAPPSVHPEGIIYRVISTTKDIIEVDDLKSLKLPGKKQKRVTPQTKARAGGRNNTAFKLVCSYRNMRYNVERALQELITWNQNNVKPMLPLEELEAIVNGAYKYEKPVHDLITNFFDYTNLGEQLIEKNPIYYDKTKLWWLWNKQTKSWKKEDETELFISVENALENASFTTKSKNKNEIIEVLKRAGRRNAPKDPKKTWVQFGENIYDVLTGEKFNASPEWFMTNPIPFSVGESEDTPTIDRMFQEWVVGKGQDETWVQTLHEVCAYTLLAQQPLQKLFALNGAGSNGKGCFVKLLQRLLGQDNYVATELSLLSDKNVRFETSFIYRKLAVLMTELQESELKNTVLLKKISGEDSLRYEFKGKDGFTENSYATCILSTNSLPTTRDKTAGYYRRWLIIDFPNTFEVTGKDIIDEIPDTELENWAKKLLRIGKELLERGKFTNEGSTDDKERRYEERSNPIQHFINENYEEEPDDYEVFSIFYKRLTDWLKRNNIRKISAREAGARLRSEGYDIQKQGITVKSNETDNYGYEKEKQTTRNVVYGIKWREELKVSN